MKTGVEVSPSSPVRRRSIMIASGAAQPALRPTHGIIISGLSCCCCGVGGSEDGRRDGGATQDGDRGRHADGTFLERVNDAVVIGVLDVGFVDSQQDVAFVEILAARSIQDLLDFLAVDRIGDGEAESHVTLGNVDDDDFRRRKRRLRMMGVGTARSAGGSKRRNSAVISAARRQRRR